MSIEKTIYFHKSYPHPTLYTKHYTKNQSVQPVQAVQPPKTKKIHPPSHPPQLRKRDKKNIQIYIIIILLYIFVLYYNLQLNTTTKPAKN